MTSSNAPSYGGKSGQRCPTAAVRSTNGADGSGWSQRRPVLEALDSVEDEVERREAAEESSASSSSIDVGRRANGKRIVTCAGHARRRAVRSTAPRARRQGRSGRCAWHARRA